MVARYYHLLMPDVTRRWMGTRYIVIMMAHRVRGQGHTVNLGEVQFGWRYDTGQG